MGKNFLIIASIFVLLEVYIYQAVKTITDNVWARNFYWAITIIIYCWTALEAYEVTKGERSQQKINTVATLFLVFVLPKLFIVLFLLIDDILRLFQFVFSFSKSDVNYFPERRKFLSLMGLGLGGVFSMLFADGIIFGKFRYKVRNVKLKLKNTPKNFIGYKIVQISDVHSGSFTHPEKIQKAIRLINDQNPDLVLFTGDMVNNRSDEFVPFVDLFSTITSKDGKFSVLGNHDYGDYAKWNSIHEKQKNLNDLIDLQKKAGFEMLSNTHKKIERNGESIYIIGVENWGLAPFPQYGDLDKATEGVPKDSLKILMSHDPTHFDYVVKNHPNNIQLTLSGHTHGMQFGLDLKNIKWSPIQYRYKKWADLYKSEGKYLYVNRGFGVLGYPGRVGILPEITVFELQ